MTTDKTKETWKIAVSRKETQWDTLWVSSGGRYCQTDGTHPLCLEGDLDDYIIDIGAMKNPIELGQYGNFPAISRIGTGEKMLICYRLFEKYFIENGIIDKPITYVLSLPINI